MYLPGARFSTLRIYRRLWFPLQIKKVEHWTLGPLEDGIGNGREHWSYNNQRVATLEMCLIWFQQYVHHQSRKSSSPNDLCRHHTDLFRRMWLKRTATNLENYYKWHRTCLGFPPLYWHHEKHQKYEYWGLRLASQTDKQWMNILSSIYGLSINIYLLIDLPCRY